MELLDGKALAAAIQEKIKGTIKAGSGREPHLAVVLVGENAASEIYIRRKQKACAEVGMRSTLFHYPADIDQASLLQKIGELNRDAETDGILVQLPLPKHINPKAVTLAIDPGKDVDGFHPLNVGKLLNGETDGFVPCTPLGIKTLLQCYEIALEGKHVVVLGRSNIVGKPMAALLMQNAEGANATVTVAHSKTSNLSSLCCTADVLIAAMGRPLFVKRGMVKRGAVIVDVGINKIEDPKLPAGYRIVGDVDFEDVARECSYITPVPGGVGPLTIAMLLQNTLKSYQHHHAT